VVEQGLSFTVVLAPNPLESDASEWDGRRDFYSAHRVWLGGLKGTDWLHDAAEEAFVPSGHWLSVDSERRSTHTGASGEVATVVLMLMGAGALNFLRKFSEGFAQRFGEASADAVLEWARQRARERGTPHDGPPDFHEDEPDRLAEGMRSELADLLRVPQERVELVRAERRESFALRAVYRDTETGREYTGDVGHDAVTFKRVGAAMPDAERPARRRLPWQR
jgi:hypothetical protein